MTAANDLAVRRALEAAGVEFIDEDGGGPGVRLQKPSVKIIEVDFLAGRCNLTDFLAKAIRTEFDGAGRRGL